MGEFSEQQWAKYQHAWRCDSVVLTSGTTQAAHLESHCQADRGEFGHQSHVSYSRSTRRLSQPNVLHNLIILFYSLFSIVLNTD